MSSSAVNRFCVRRGCGREFKRRTLAEQEALIRGFHPPAFANLYCDKCVVEKAKTAPPPIVEKRE